MRDDDIARAREEGATDTEIHDTVLIAAAFCMYNRYVDGLGAWTPDDREGIGIARGWSPSMATPVRPWLPSHARG